MPHPAASLIPQGLYLLLVTNKSSNILEDLETLRLLSKVIPEYVHPVDEEAVCLGAFDLIFAFDEVISMGHKENITVIQVTPRNLHVPQGNITVIQACSPIPQWATRKTSPSYRQALHPPASHGNISQT